MPLEVTPVPFVGQQLPYNPKFVREPDMPGSGDGSMTGGGGGGSMVSGPGPYAAAASALIAPTPGGVAGPHKAIPALPDAGYTAPGIRIGGLGLDLQGSSSARSSISDGYGPAGQGMGMGQGYMGQGSVGPGSMMGGGRSIGGHARSGFVPDLYGGQMSRGGVGAPNPPMSTISSHSWAPEANFSAPRRTPHPALVPSMAESTIAPRGVSQQRGQAIDPRHQLDIPPPHSGHGHHGDHQAHRHSHHQGHRSQRQEFDVDDWDSKSDASYYARPKVARARSSSTMSDITTSTSATATARPSLPHHTSHHRGSPGQHDHSPISPSPLTRDLPHGHSHSHNQQPGSPLSPRVHSSVRHTRKISGLAGDGGGGIPALPSPYKKVTPLAPESDYSVQDPRPLREGSERGNRRNSISHGSADGHIHGRRRLASPQGYASDDECRYSSRSHSGRRDKIRHRQEDLGDGSVYSTSSRRQPKHRAEAYPDDPYVSSNQHGRREDQNDRERDRGHGHGQGHSYSRSLPRVPPPLPYRAPSPAQAATLQIPHRHHLMPDIGALSISGETQGRRRAHSMQMQHHHRDPPPQVQGQGQGQGHGHGHGQGGLPISSSASLAGFGGAEGGTGGPGYASGRYQTPSMVGGGDAYDDGASVAGSAMTFMDGPVAGRTSQYGLPKYPHQAKPDYRRFMVQRGKADVYLD